MRMPPSVAKQKNTLSSSSTNSLLVAFEPNWQDRCVVKEMEMTQNNIQTVEQNLD